MAVELGIGFIPVRKPGKLPVPKIGIDYALEYGATGSESTRPRLRPASGFAIVDDLIATGGTALSAAELLRQAGAAVNRRCRDRLPDLVRRRAATRRGPIGRCADGLSRH